VNGNLTFLEMESESKLRMASPSRHMAGVPPVALPVLVLQWPSCILLPSCSKGKNGLWKSNYMHYILYIIIIL